MRSILNLGLNLFVNIISLGGPLDKDMATQVTIIIEQTKDCTC
jgi:hypothetical protein